MDGAVAGQHGARRQRRDFARHRRDRAGRIEPGETCRRGRCCDRFRPHFVWRAEKQARLRLHRLAALTSEPACQQKRVDVALDGPAAV